mmetsp:Transcript_12175/g.22019  ORF Transcript_12175/g.22019 Transcript_12175/m.22019 type:complete len:159 (-) Transcript_12175:1259-1735(-)|eukprot:CAMPEP_0182442128 /NCGR_PEP_ID=MMETSP1172-20130603/1081_1 /TAXON_ID=708627 /ORGANISM="Timspurckia oligopyrenoides, Strain CCMP3278" /LENGTH=158 /DNA_ID=CAMNT_0024636835 /DNA_START=150 /DNA_END=626 /DNA_ORIENTATION=-
MTRPEIFANGLLAVFSLVEFGTAADFCSEVNSCGNRLGWAVAVGVISFVIATTMFFLHLKEMDLADKADKFVALFLMVWWIGGVASNTSPRWGGSGILNIYYFSWAAFFASLYYVAHTAGAFGIPDMRNMMGGSKAAEHAAEESNSPKERRGVEEVEV